MRDVELRNSNKSQLSAGRERSSRGASRCRLFAASWIAVTSGAGMAMLLPAPGHAQSGQPGQPVPCAEKGQAAARPDTGAAFPRRQIDWHDRAEQRNATDGPRIPRRYPVPRPGRPAVPRREHGCRGLPRHGLRVERGPGPASASADPVPGPTLRARVGDIVPLTFLNQVIPATTEIRSTAGRARARLRRNLGALSGPGEHSPTASTDRAPATSISTARTPARARPATTSSSRCGPPPGENDSRSSPRRASRSRSRSSSRLRVPSEQQRAVAMATDMERPSAGLDEPAGGTAQAYDSNPAIANKLWPVNAAQIQAGAWPQYYIGAFPYCFRLPGTLDNVARRRRPPARAWRRHEEGRPCRWASRRAPTGITRTSTARPRSMSRTA